jgi:biotin carboxylase
MALLVLHTSNASRRAHFVTARRRCERLALMMSPVGWEAGYVDTVVEAGAHDVEACVEAALALHERDTVDGVVTFVEHCMVTAAAVAHALGVPFVSVESARLARDKFAMRSRASRAGLACPAFGLARDAAEACRLARRLSYPLVLKPIIGGGSKYVVRVDSDAEVHDSFDRTVNGAWASFRHDALWPPAREEYGEALLVEQYLDGAEVSVESLILDGETVPIVIHDKPEPMAGPFFEERYSCTPSRHDPLVQQALRESTIRLNRALGLDMGATHTEFRITGDGPVFLEVAARIGGGPIYGSVLASTGVDMVEAVIDQALGRRVRLPAIGCRPTGLLDFFADADGRVVAVEGADELRADPAVVELEVYRRPGDLVLAPPKTSQGDAHAVFVGDTLADVDALCERIQHMLRFRVAAGSVSPEPAASGHEGP